MPRITLLLATAAVLAAPANTQAPPAAVQAAPETSAQAKELATKATAAGATDVVTRPAPNGGTTIGGKLNGAQFALSFPANWNGDGLVYAHGYTTPGTPVAVDQNPVSPGPGGLMKLAYEDGLAAGHSAYDKDGLGVETGVNRTKALRDFLVKLGAKQVYVAGDSMGGGITVTLLEMYPKDFAGGLARCGVVSSWKTLLGQIYDMRAAYNTLTAGTPYQLPGEQDVRQSALLPAGGGTDGEMAVWGRLGQVATPVLALYAAAQKDPNGREARIVKQVAAIGGFDVDPGSLGFPIVTAALGATDMAAVTGGQPFGNVGKVYAANGLNPDELKELNAKIQRVAISPKAVEYLNRWRETTGRISVPLVLMHNTIDSLVPFAQQTAFEAKVKKAGRSQYLAAYGVPPKRAPLPVGDRPEAYTHCGFSPEQNKAAWTALRTWTTTGKRPAADAVK